MKKWQFLHMTDLHFVDTFTCDDKEPIPKEYRDNLRNVLTQKVRAFAPKGPNDTRPIPDAVFITGDLSNSGEREGFTNLSSDWGGFFGAMAEKRIVAVVPGNHDVADGLEQSDPSFFDHKFEHFLEFLTSHPRIESCLIPRGGLDGGQIQFREDRRSPVVIDEKRHLVVICINSAIRCREINARRLSTGINLLKEVKPTADTKRLEAWIKERCAHDIAHVTEAQRVRLERDLIAAQEKHGEDWWQSALKVAVLHHHLVGFPGSVEHKTFESTVDAPQVLKLLAQFGVQLVLTGHKHQNYETHQIIRLGGREHHMVVAGGPTALGGVVEARRGLNQVEVTRTENGAMTFRFRTLEIESGSRSLAQQWNSPDWSKRRTVEIPGNLILPGANIKHPPQNDADLPIPVNPLARSHQAARIYSGVGLMEYCYYCKYLAESSREFLFTLLTIDPVRLIKDMYRGGWPDTLVDFRKTINQDHYHFSTFQKHENGVRLVVVDDKEWVNRNRKAFEYLVELNGKMRCYVAKREDLLKMGGVLLADHTAVASTICMYDREALMMTTGPINVMDEGGFYAKLRNPEKIDKAKFTPLTEYIRLNEDVLKETVS